VDGGDAVKQGSAEWLEARRSGIGGSEAATLYGEGFLSPWMLWAKKTGREPERQATLKPGQDQRMYWGNAHEREIMKGYQLFTGRAVTDGVTMHRHPDIPIMIANTDGIVAPIEGYDGPGVWEAKTADAYLRKEWFAEDGEPSAPLGYQVQAQHYMACTGAKWASFGVLFGGNRLEWFDFHRNDRFIHDLERRCLDWWCRYVIADDPPPVDETKKTEVAMRLIFGDDDGSVVRLPDGFKFLRDWWDHVDGQAKNMKAEQQRLRNLVIVTMGRASVGTCFDGQGFTFRAGTDGQRRLYRVGEGAIRTATRGRPEPPMARVTVEVAQALEVIEACVSGRDISLDHING